MPLVVLHIPNGVLLSWVLSKVKQLWLCSVVHLFMGGDISDILTRAEVDTLRVMKDRAKVKDSSKEHFSEKCRVS